MSVFSQDFLFGLHSTRVVVASGSLARVGETIRERLPSLPREGAVLLITDENVGTHYGDACARALREGGFVVSERRVPAGEGAKSFRVLENTYSALADQRLGRDGLIVGLGGGAVTDLAGFVAATWMRGVRLVLCPTTVEAAIDAAIGGKNAINLVSAKNMVGTFHQPELVIIDPETFRTLPPRDVRAGLAESVKHALITSEEFLAWHEREASVILQLEKNVIKELIARNIQIKAGFVERDVRDEKGIRVALNFGHTVGHAIEACCDFRLRHGECVALGMIAALAISRKRGLVDEALVARVVALLDAIGLPTRLYETIDSARILEAMRKDKKNEAGKLRFVLLTGIGRPVLCDDVREDEVLEAYRTL